NYANPVVASVGDVEVAGGAYRDARGRVEDGRRPIARDGGDDAVGADLADPVVAGIGEEEVTGGIHRDAVRLVKLGLRGRTVVAAEARYPSARDGGDDAVGADLADPVVAGVGDVEVAGGVHRDALRMVELGSRGRTAVATEARYPSARDGTDGDRDLFERRGAAGEVGAVAAVDRLNRLMHARGQRRSRERGSAGVVQCAGAEISRSVEEVDRAGGHGSARRIGGYSGREGDRLAEHRGVRVGGQRGGGAVLVDHLAAGKGAGAGAEVASGVGVVRLDGVAAGSQSDAGAGGGAAGQRHRGAQLGAVHDKLHAAGGYRTRAASVADCGREGNLLAAD